MRLLKRILQPEAEKMTDPASHAGQNVHTCLLLDSQPQAASFCVPQSPPAYLAPGLKATNSWAGSGGPYKKP